MAKPKKRFARVNLTTFERLRSEEAALCGDDAVHEGVIIGERASGDRRATAFAGWSAGVSARDLWNRYRFAMGQQGKDLARMIYIAEEVFQALCVQARIQQDLVRLEREQQPVPRTARIEQRAQQQELHLVVAEAEEIDQRVADALRQQPLRILRETRRGVVRNLSLLEGAPLVTQPTMPELRQQVIAQLEREALYKQRRLRPWVPRVPAAQLKLFL